jgi:hypothetical protein
MEQNAAVDRLAKRPVEHALARLSDTANRSTEMPDAAPMGNSAQSGQSALTVDQRVGLRRRLEDLAAVEANRVEPVAAAGSEPLDAYLVGIRSDVHDALAKMADGTYGDCETCQGTIPVARLEAVPYARRCLACQEREENGWHPVQRLVGSVAEVAAGKPQGRSDAGS